MNKLALIAAFSLLTLPMTAFAEEHAAPGAHAEAAKEMVLKDGTKVEVEGDMVSIVAADGKTTPAPDGEHELADETKITVKDGKLVH
jgi:predicted ThiF/HesA family dinucleotide-utilizing enzyme